MITITPPPILTTCFHLSTTSLSLYTAIQTLLTKPLHPTILTSPSSSSFLILSVIMRTSLRMRLSSLVHDDMQVWTRCVSSTECPPWGTLMNPAVLLVLVVWVWGRVWARKSSSMSSTLARSDLDDLSCKDKS